MVAESTINFISKIKKDSTKIFGCVVSFVMIAGIVSNISPMYVFAQENKETNNTTTLPLLPENASSSENETTVGDQISDFVHNATQIFKQEKNETLQTIKDCHAKLANATGTERNQIMDTCKTNLRAIHDKYAEIRTKYQDLFKQFRENMHVFVKEATGQAVDSNEKKQALDHIMGIKQQMLKEGTHVLQGINGTMKGHKMTSSGHPMIGHGQIEKGKKQIRKGTNDINKTKSHQTNVKIK